MLLYLLLLRHRISRPGVCAVLIAALALALLCTFSHWLIRHQQLENERELMNARGERFVGRLEQIFAQLRSAVDELDQQPVRGCGEPMLQLLRQVGIDYRFVFEAAYLEGGKVCSNRMPVPVTSTVHSPDLQGETYSYWLNTTEEPDENRAALMMGRGEFRVSTSRGHLSDVVELPAHGSLLMVVDQGRQAIPVLGPAQAWPPPGLPPTPTNALSVTDDHLIYRMATRFPDYQLVMITPRAELPSLMETPLWLFYPFSLLLALLTGWTVFQSLTQRQSLESALQGALRRREIRVMYQPIFDLDSRRCVGAEALVRWRRHDGSLTSPELFIPLAENSGLIRHITDFVLQSILEQLGTVLRANKELYVSVNLAACDVTEPRIASVAARLLKIHRVLPTQIAFEVTERGLVDVDLAQKTLGAFRERGHKVLIDDFGTGYSSLAYLQNLPVDCLKIDKAFVDALGEDAASSGVAPHIIRMAHALGMKVIAEGIESEAQAELLHGEGVDYGQGWLFAEALDARQFRELVAMPAGPLPSMA